MFLWIIIVLCRLYNPIAFLLSINYHLFVFQFSHLLMEKLISHPPSLPLYRHLICVFCTCFCFYIISLDTGREPTVKTAAHLMRRLIYNNKDRLMAGVIIAGWDEVAGGSVYTITLGGSCLELPFASGGSGSVFIAGLLDSEFRPGMSQEEARNLAKKACSHAMTRDGSSGGVIRTVAITSNGVHRDYTSGNELPFGPSAVW